MEGARLHKDMEIRSKWENMENEGQESELGDGSGRIDGGRVGKDGLQVICTQSLKTNQRKTKKVRDLVILTYFDLQTKNMMNRSLLAENHAR